jgi:hypothetical protein
MVRLLVNTPAEARETVEQTLQAYGATMAQHQPPPAWLVDRVQMDRLRQYLEGTGKALHLTYNVPPQSEPLDIPLPLTVAERLRHLRQLVGNALHNL